MRLLSIGTDHVGGGTAASQSRSQRCRHRRGTRGKHLPLRYLFSNSQSHPPGSPVFAWRSVAVTSRSRERASAAGLGRRVFLQRAAWMSGGLVLAVALPAVRGGPRAAAVSGSQLNAWLRIGTDDSITILVDRSEMGQGVYTALPTLIAEELEVDLSRIRIAAAPPGDAYVNVLNGGQVTGTSNSVPEAWEKLRKAGAQARSMLIAAAAQRWRVAVSDCRAIDGKIVSSHGRTASYGQLAEAAAKLPVPQGVTLKDKAQFRLIGKSLPRLDTPNKVDGSAEFGLDVQLPGMLYAVIALCPTLGGKVASVDSAAARAMPGVRTVLTTTGGVVVVADHFWQ